jgi:amino acid transporter
MLLSLSVATAVFVLVAGLGSTSLGNDIQGASAFLHDKQQLNLGGSAVSMDPTMALLSTISTDNSIVRILLMMGFLAWVWFWVPGLMSYGERAVLAWSLDRVVPAVFGRLHERLGTPIVAIVAVVALAEIFLALIVWTEFFSTLVFILAGALAWGLALFFGALFPFTRRSLFERTAIGAMGAKGRFMMAAGCALGSVAMAIICVLLMSDELAIGDLKKGIITIGLCFALGFLIFSLSAWYLKRSGIELRRAFEEIPVE